LFKIEYSTLSIYIFSNLTLLYFILLQLKMAFSSG
jgi:hypothetical protein